MTKTWHCSLRSGTVPPSVVSSQYISAGMQPCIMTRKETNFCIGTGVSGAACDCIRNVVEQTDLTWKVG